MIMKNNKSTSKLTFAKKVISDLKTNEIVGGIISREQRCHTNNGIKCAHH